MIVLDQHAQLHAAVKSWLDVKEAKREAVKEFNDSISELEEEIATLSYAIERDKDQVPLPMGSMSVTNGEF